VALYAAGLVLFLRAAPDDVGVLVTALQGSHSLAGVQSVLTDGGFLPSAVSVSRTAVLRRSPDVLLPAGAFLLPVAFAATAWRFERRRHWLLALLAFGPVVGFALERTGVSSAVGVQLLLYVLVPTVVVCWWAGTLAYRAWA